MGWGPPGFSVHGTFQARILECVAISSSRGSSRPRIEPNPRIKPESPVPPTLQADSLPTERSGECLCHIYFLSTFREKKNEERKEGGKAENREGDSRISVS